MSSEMKKSALLPGTLNTNDFEEALVNSLDIDAWVTGVNLAQLYSGIDEERVKSALKNEAKLDGIIRKELFPIILSNLDSIDPDIANQQFSSALIEKAHLGLLFNGATEACV